MQKSPNETAYNTPGAGLYTGQRPSGERDPLNTGAASISACIVCRNEADLLGPCLESVGWADELIVMDLSSTDRSAAVARGHGARVISREPVPFVELVRNELAAVASSEWILFLDPDERVTPGLASELRRLAQLGEIDGVVVPRTNCYFGYAPSDPFQRYEPHLRMFRRGTVTWPTFVHGIADAPGHHVYHIEKRDDLVLMHDSYRNIPEVLDRFVRYVPADAQSMLDRRLEFSGRGMLAAVSGEIDKEFFRTRAWQDGVPGTLRAATLVMYRLLVWSMFWQLSGGRRTLEDDRLIRRIGGLLSVLRQGAKVLGASYRFYRRLAGGAAGSLGSRKTGSRFDRK